MGNMIVAGWLRWSAAIGTGTLIILSLQPLGSCTYETAFTQPDSSAVKPGAGPVAAGDSAGSGHVLAYTVDSESGRGCRITIDIGAWPSDEPKIFQAPVFYADNPVMPAPGYKAADLTVRDKDGNTLQARDTVLAGINLDGRFMVLPAAARTLSYAVDLAPRDTSRFGLPIPKTAPGVDLIDGAYYFILPLLGRDYATQWRTSAKLSLEFAAMPGRTLVGTDAKMNFTTNYELMFVRAAYDPIKTRTFTMANHEVTVYATSSDTLDLDKFGGLLERCIRLVEDSLLPLPTHRYFVGENAQFWGIEGVQGYWFKAEAAALPEVHVHELTHTFVGIYHSDYDDPWWKEGVTDYLGLLLSVQTGLIGDTAFAANMLTLRDTLPAVRQYALANHYVRNHLFQTMDSAFVEPADALGFIGLVYGKGSQAAMILDRYLLEHSGGKKSIYDLIRDIVSSYGTAFHRSQLEASVDRLAGGSSSVFLGNLLDQAAPLGADSLAHTYAALRTLGRFGPIGGKAKIAGVDPAPAGAAKASAAPVTRLLPGVPAGSKL